MPGFLFPGRPGGEHDEPLLDMIIARRACPGGVVARAQAGKLARARKTPASRTPG